jgi:hypothetical protein
VINNKGTTFNKNTPGDCSFVNTKPDGTMKACKAHSKQCKDLELITRMVWGKVQYMRGQYRIQIQEAREQMTKSSPASLKNEQM